MCWRQLAWLFHFTSTVYVMLHPVTIDLVYLKCWHVDLGREDLATQQIQPYTFAPSYLGKVVAGDPVALLPDQPWGDGPTILNISNSRGALKMKMPQPHLQSLDSIVGGRAPVLIFHRNFRGDPNIQPGLKMAILVFPGKERAGKSGKISETWAKSERPEGQGSPA